MLRRREQVLWRAAGRDVIVTMAEKEGFDKLSGPCAAVWTLLETPRRREEIVNAISEMYQRHPAAVGRDLSTIFENMLQLGLVEEVASGE